MSTKSYYVILFHTICKFDVFIGVDIVMCHALIIVKEFHQAKTLSMFQSILLFLGKSINYDNALYISNYYINVDPLFQRLWIISGFP